MIPKSGNQISKKHHAQTEADVDIPQRIAHRQHRKINKGSK
jgi:hypothetical protein